MHSGGTYKCGHCRADLQRPSVLPPVPSVGSPPSNTSGNLLATGVSVLCAWGFCSAVVAGLFNIVFTSALIGVAAVSLVLWVAASISAWWERRKPCQHGVPAGAHGQCAACQAEAQRIQREREAAEFKRSQQEALKAEARRVREQEIERLSKGWLSNTKSYFEMTPRQFEDAIAELFRKLGYEVRQTPFSNDGGLDAIARKDGKKYLIECKRYAATATIGRRDLQIFYAAMMDEKADGGIYINTGIFASTAAKYAEGKGILLYDRSRLPILVNQAFPMAADTSQAKVVCLECGALTALPVGDERAVAKCARGHIVTSNIVRADFRFVPLTPPNCDRCGSPMRSVEWRGNRFWGCSGYPRCKATKPLLQASRHKAGRWTY